MKQIEISGLSLDWFQNYLNETKQCNMINGCHFSWADVVLGGGGGRQEQQILHKCIEFVTCEIQHLNWASLD